MHSDEYPHVERIPRWLIRMEIIWIVLLFAFIGWLLWHANEVNEGRVSPTPGVEPWWDQRMSGRLGGWAGMAGGVFGALVGTLGGVIGSLAGSGKARGVVTALMNVVVWSCALGAAVGLATLIAGLFAWSQGQPYWVYNVLIHLGGILFLVFGGICPGIIWMKNHILPLRYQYQELRRMRAMDTR